jgi:hypothetical protein
MIKLSPNAWGIFAALLVLCLSHPAQSAPPQLGIAYQGQKGSQRHAIREGQKNYTKKILFIGDSHAVGAFGKELFNRLKIKYPASKLYFYAVCGSSPSWWLNGHETNCGYWQLNSAGYEIKGRAGFTPDLRRLLKDIEPSLIILEQGTNLIKFKPADVESEIVQLTSLIKSMTSAKIFWVGPPDVRAYSKKAVKWTFRKIQETCSRQRPKITVIDSLKLTKYPASGKDGIHYDGPKGEVQLVKWAEKVANQIHF